MLLQSATAFFMTKCDGLLLQSTTAFLLQSATSVITKCDRYYKVRQYNVLKTTGTSVLQHCYTQSKEVVCSEMFHRSSVNCLSKSYYQRKVSKRWSVRVVALVE